MTFGGGFGVNGISKRSKECAYLSAPVSRRSNFKLFYLVEPSRGCICLLLHSFILSVRAINLKPHTLGLIYCNHAQLLRYT